jgi:hypothetical protein
MVGFQNLDQSRSHKGCRRRVELQLLAGEVTLHSFTQPLVRDLGSPLQSGHGELDAAVHNLAGFQLQT